MILVCEVSVNEGQSIARSVYSEALVVVQELQEQTLYMSPIQNRRRDWNELNLVRGERRQSYDQLVACQTLRFLIAWNLSSWACRSSIAQ